MNPHPLPIRRKLRAALLFLLLAITAAVLFIRKDGPEPPPVTILHQPYTLPITRRDRFALTFFPGSSLTARLETLLFGRRKTLNIVSDIFTLTETQLSKIKATFDLPPPIYSNSNTLQIWFLKNPDLDALSQKLMATPGINFEMHPRISTAEGINSSISFTRPSPINPALNTAGLNMSVAAHFRKHSLELLTQIINSDVVTNTPPDPALGAPEILSILTNINLHARFNLPNNTGIFFIQNTTQTSNNPTLGCLLKPSY